MGRIIFIIFLIHRLTETAGFGTLEQKAAIPVR